MEISYQETLNNDKRRKELEDRQADRRRRTRKNAYYPEADDYARDVGISVQPSVVQTSDVVNNAKETGKVPADNYIFYENGKPLKPEDAFKASGYAVYIASLFRMYHDAIGYENAEADIEMFIAIASEAISLYGPEVNVSPAAVAASSFHMEVSKAVPYRALRDAKTSLTTNVARSVYSDMILSGDTGFVADTVTGAVVIKDDPGLSKTATKAMGSFFQTQKSPKEEIVKVVSNLAQVEIDFVADLQDEVDDWLTSGNLPDIDETQPFRSLTSMPGLLSPEPVATGNQGFYHGIYSFLSRAEKSEPYLLLVPKDNHSKTGSCDSLGFASRVVSLPDDLRHATPHLASINVAKFDDVVKGMRDAEITVSEDPFLKADKSLNARSYYHEQFRDDYTRYVNEPHGTTRRQLSYVTLFKADPIVAQELYTLFVEKKLDHNPVMMRASEYHLATLKGVKGSFVVTDLPAMVGVYLSPQYVKSYIKKAYYEEKTFKIVTTVGFYVLNTYKTGSVNVYSSWIQKYVLARMLDTLYPIKGYGKRMIEVYTTFIARGKGKQKSAALIQNTISALSKCYNKIRPKPSLIVVLAPNLSMRKALKYTKLLLDDDEAVDKSDNSPSEDDSSGDDEDPVNPFFDSDGDDTGRLNLAHVANAYDDSGDDDVPPETPDDDPCDDHSST